MRDEVKLAAWSWDLADSGHEFKRCFKRLSAKVGRRLARTNIRAALTEMDIEKEEDRREQEELDLDITYPEDYPLEERWY